MLTCAFALCLCCSCKPQKDAAPSFETVELKQTPLSGHAVMPRAVVYRTNGDYNDRVPVALNADGSALVSYPAPSDLTSSSAPVPLGHGYLLDRRGVGPNTAFLSMTYDQYRALKQAPSPAELMHLIIPGAKIEQMIELPISASQAAADIPAVENYMKSDWKNCKIIIP